MCACGWAGNRYLGGTLSQWRHGFGLQGSRRRCDRECRARSDAGARRARVPVRRGRCGRILTLAGERGRIRRHRQDAQMQEYRTFRFHRLGHRVVRGRVRRIQDLCAQSREGGMRGDRQFFALPDGPGRSADRAGGKSGRDFRIFQAQHHRQPELFDRADGRRIEASARCRHDQARGRLDLPIGLGRREGRDGRTVRAEPRDLRRRQPRAGKVPEADRLQRHPPDRRLPR